MGNSTSGIIADMVLEDLEEESMKKLPFELPYYKRYVDDVNTAIPSNQQDKVLEVFNEYHPRLQFTIETEENDSINFLDMTLVKDSGGHIKTKWYQKEIASQRYLNYRANNPAVHKRNVVTGMVDRAITLTDPKERPKCLKKVRTIMAKNGYPPEFTSKIISDRTDRFYNGNQNPKNTEMKWLTLPYIPGLTDRLKKTLRKYNITVACKMDNTIGKLFTHTKYVVPKLKRSNLIYNADCLMCPMKYVGETGQRLTNRNSGHKTDIKAGKLTETTALCQHAVQKKHNIDFDGIKILGHAINKYERRIAESMHIVRTPNAMNKKDAENLHPSYKHILKKYKTN